MYIKLAVLLLKNKKVKKYSRQYMGNDNNNGIIVNDSDHTWS